jgi:hypothetical protein
MQGVLKKSFLTAKHAKYPQSAQSQDIVNMVFASFAVNGF